MKSLKRLLFIIVATIVAVISIFPLGIWWIFTGKDYYTQIMDWLFTKFEDIL